MSRPWLIEKWDIFHLVLSQDPHHRPHENQRGDQRDRDRQNCLSLLVPDSSPSPVWMLLHERSHCPAELSQHAEPFEIITISDSCDFTLSLFVWFYTKFRVIVTQK